MAKFSFVSDQAAINLSNAALHKSLLSSNSLSQMVNAVGVGCTSALTSVPKKKIVKDYQDKEKHGSQSSVDQGRLSTSRAHLCLSFPDGFIRHYSLTFGTKQNLATIEEEHDEARVFSAQKSRREEEESLGTLILWSVIGTDTMVRLLNPKYYNNDREQMLETIREMGKEGVHFCVGGRLEQQTGSQEK